MNEKEVRSLCTRLARVFSINLPLTIASFLITDENRVMEIHFSQGEIVGELQRLKDLSIGLDDIGRIIFLRIENLIKYVNFEK
ncbi:MAG TPA: hypothetical protein VJ044_05755 [Candidatus Hodarchaeales archaeon]|nr:hypothetical protein [Candidatus Hodarchaeales archaeon]